jgi:4-alpha-glucanotransferase
MIDIKEKLAGLLIPVFALRRENDLGIGDTQAVQEAIDFCARTNAAVLQLLPINETGGDNSPYNAISSVSLDPVLLTLSPDVVPGLTNEMLSSLADQAQLKKLRTGAVDYQAVKALKLKLLRAAFESFEKNGSSSQKSEFKIYEEAQKSWLPAYTLFRTLVSVHNGDCCWTQWPEEHRDPKQAEAWLVQQKTGAAGYLVERQFYAYVQWIAHQQWKSVRAHADKRAVRLMGDIPFGVSRYSADVWANQSLFDLDWSGGAPPETQFRADPFTAKWGQNWGLPNYRWDEHEKEGYAWWHQRVHKCVEIFHHFRIDHVLGFFRIYSFPWVPERNSEFLALSQDEAKQRTGGRAPRFIPRSDERPEDAKLNAQDGRGLLEMILSAAGNAGVVAEDLGLVPNYVRPLLQNISIPGFTIPQWTRNESTYEYLKRNELPELSLATYATHDHPPLVMLYQDMVNCWHGPDGNVGWLEMQRLMRFLGLDDNNPPTDYTPELHRAFLKALFETPCWLVVLMITDLLAIGQCFNQPGTAGQSNWSERLDHPLSWYEKNDPYKTRIELFAGLVRDTRRLPLAWQAGTIR